MDASVLLLATQQLVTPTLISPIAVWPTSLLTLVQARIGALTPLAVTLREALTRQLATLVPGTLTAVYVDEVPPGTEFPYLVFSMLGGVRVGSAAGGLVIERHLIQATTWTDDATALGTLEAAVLAAVEDQEQALAYSTGRLIRIRRGDPPAAPRDATPSPVNTDVHSQVHLFECLTQRTIGA